MKLKDFYTPELKQEEVEEVPVETKNIEDAVDTNQLNSIYASFLDSDPFSKTNPYTKNN